MVRIGLGAANSAWLGNDLSGSNRMIKGVMRLMSIRIFLPPALHNF
jgi:hypothetical protein